MSLLIAPLPRCVCACCKDALRRLETGRQPEAACNCADYAKPEQRDCAFCAAVLSGAHRS